MLSPMRIDFLKMQGLGNDFLVFDAAANTRLDSRMLRALADRHTGVGFDQALMLESPRDPDSRVFYRVFNSDGCEVEQCGNGARCFVKFVRERKLTGKAEIRVETLGGTIVPKLEADGEVTVDMGPPRMASPLTETLSIQGEAVELTVLSMGNPHAVQVVPEVEAAPVRTQGPLLERHARFPNRVNAGYMQVLDRHRIALRVWERGAGETLSCGTGACAAAVAGIQRGLLDSPVRVDTRGGTLTISWAGGDNGVRMKGPAQTVFEGQIEVDEV
jgi:diaminopimelate epimerase